MCCGMYAETENSFQKLVLSFDHLVQRDELRSSGLTARTLLLSHLAYSLSILLFEAGSLSERGSHPFHYGSWPASKPQECICLYLYKAGVMGIYYHNSLFAWNWGAQTKITILAQLTLDQLSHPQPQILYFNCNQAEPHFTVHGFLCTLLCVGHPIQRPSTQPLS